ncbi:alpha-(1-_3)-arabinofuranosyltransferase domain-containing protein [Knoellia sp. CPCC 206450]|uniref:alpha-(1->3)-arabinofuranosyltransferase domain-containing protein n=1 Tax=Knoellia tibetensis TaxID=3404798 RepID=UPI003B42FFEE
MRWRRLPDPATAAGLLVVWAVAWSVTPGRIAEDTKNDLYVDPWGFLARSLHLWDPQVTWGGLSNQGYGYLFPMGPFFALGSEIAPVWVVQRLWWTVLLTAGFVGTLGLLRALGVGTPRTRIVGALAYVLAPRVVSSVAGLSAEIQPQLLAPLVLWPLVAASRGRLSTTRAASLSGVAALCCGGVNATATLCALVPAGLWLLTRRRWWRSRLTWSWAAAIVAATAWWLGPLLVMSRYSPPFLDWIENAQAVMRPVGMLDVVRGTTHWLGHVLTPGGAWWPAGHELVASPILIVLTSAVAALGLAGLAPAHVPERRWLWASLLLGGVLLTVAHSGPLSSPLVGTAQAALDGPLAPLRNVHKVDLLVRLPLVVGLTHVLGLLAGWRLRAGWHRQLALGAAVVTVVAAAAPGFTGAIAVRGTFERMPQHWVDTGRWLGAQRGEGQALVVPAANFGEYQWGRTIDEPLRPLTRASYAVRDAVPLAPAGTIRLLDEIERRLQTGRGLDGGVEVLARAGIKHLVVRNDLATNESGQPPVAFARSSVRATTGVTLAKGFGPTFLDATGERVFPVEVYDLPVAASASLELWDVAAAVGASGASEDLVRLADAGLLTGPVVFDGDRTNATPTPATRVDTDGLRLRERWFGAPRGQDLTPTLTAARGRDVPDYLPWTDRSLQSSVTYTGIADVGASSSVAEDLGFAGLRPARRPFAALDGDPGTGWAAMWDERPTLTVDLSEPVSFDHVVLTGLGPVSSLGDSVRRPTRVRVSADDAHVEATLGVGPQRVDLPAGPHSSVRVEILETEEDAPGRVVTGLAELTIPGVAPREVVDLPDGADAPRDTSAVVLGSGLPGRDGCTSTDAEFVCLSGQSADPEQTGSLVRSFSGERPGEWDVRGTLAPRGAGAAPALTSSPGVVVTTSSVRTDAPQARPDALVDGDDRTAWSPAFDDETPEVLLEFDRPVTVSTVRLQARRDWAERAAPAVVLDIGGKEVTRRVQPGGVVEIPPTTGTSLRLTFVRVPTTDDDALPNAALELEAVDLAGTTFRAPRDAVEATCGSGPRLVVDGREVPTRASVTRDQLFGLGAGTWSACEPVRFDDRRRHAVEVGAWQGLTARSAVLRMEGQGAPRTATPTSVAAATSGSGWIATITPSDGARLLVLDQNANAGWVARVAGTELRPQVVDGRRQAFVVPAGASGELSISFGPDGAYRALLLLGLALAAGLGLTALIALRRPTTVTVGVLVDARDEAARPTRRTPAVVLSAAAVLAGTLVAGPAGAGAALAGVLAAHALGRGGRRRATGARPAALTVAAGVLACGVAQAVVSPGSLGPAVLEGALRVVLVAVVTLAALAAVGEQPRREA